MLDAVENVLDSFGDSIQNVVILLFNCIYDAIINFFLKVPFVVSKLTGEKFISVLFDAFGGFEPHEYIGILVTFSFAVIAVKIVFDIISSIVG